jgi:ABC-type polysaccharide transport system permease subunit
MISNLKFLILTILIVMICSLIFILAFYLKMGTFFNLDHSRLYQCTDADDYPLSSVRSILKFTYQSTQLGIQLQ